MPLLHQAVYLMCLSQDPSKNMAIMVVMTVIMCPPPRASSLEHNKTRSVTCRAAIPAVTQQSLRRAAPLAQQHDLVSGV